MNIYRFIFSILIILFIFENILKRNKKVYETLKKISILFLILLCTFKGEVGRDTIMYNNIFNSIPIISIENIFEDLNYTITSYRFEYGYLLLNLLIKKFTNNSIILFFIVAMISFVNLKKFLDYFSESYFYSLAFYYARYFFLKEFTQIRNGLAYSFILVSLIHLYEKNKKLFILYVIIAGSFHKSAYFVLSFFIVEKLLDKKIFRRIALILIPIIPFLEMKSIIIKVIKYIVKGKEIYLDAYLTGVFSKASSGYIAIIFSIILLYIFTIFYKKIFYNKKSKFLYKSYLYSVIISALFWGFGDIQGRLASIFNTEFVIVDKVPRIIRNKMCIKVLMILYLVVVYYMCFIKRYNLEQEYLPYFI